MKFNEKLIELRKKEGLSQEELGYKLNVTRQTISKWELGQTTPEMDKLLEMSKIFNISVDDLINESEVISNPNPIIEDQPIVEEKPKKNKIVTIIVVALIIVLTLIIFRIFFAFLGFNIFNKATDGIISETIDEQQNIFDKFFSIFDKIEEKWEENADMFNGTFDIYKGTETSTSVGYLLDKVITNNKTKDRKITVKYIETETQDAEEIKNLKTSIKESNHFEVSFDYDEKGYINKVTVEKVVTESEIRSFNSSLELYGGSCWGSGVTTVLDNIIKINKIEERKITVKYKEIETQDENEIKNIKRNFKTFDNCEITYEYDTDGFINKAIVEKL